MLLTNGQRAKIATGDMTLTFRAWTRPQVAAGNAYGFDDGRQLFVLSIAQVPAGTIDDAQAERAGEESASGMRAMLNKVTRRTIADDDLVYRIEFRLEPVTSTKVTVAPDVIVEKLARMDARSSNGPWTRDYLRMIADNPRLGAKHHAARRGQETLDLKADVRKLKALGLTVSYEVGYGLTPLGEEVLALVDDPALAR